MKKFTKKIISSLLATAVCMQGIMPVIGLAAEETEPLGNYALLAFAYGESVQITSPVISMNGSIMTNGACSLDVDQMYLNGNVEENAQQITPFLHSFIEHNYFWGDDVDAVTSDYCGTDECSDTFFVPTHIYGTYSTNDNVEIQQTSLMVGGDVDIDSNSYLSNSAVLYSASGDINIIANNVSVDGLIYAPIGTVTIDANYVNVHGSIIAQNIVINSECGINLNSAPNFINEFVNNAETVEMPDPDQEDNDPDIGAIYWKDITSDDDIIFDEESGIYIVRNQILLSCDDTISYDDVAMLADNFDAEIVGYIQFTNDYQIEFPTATELDEIRDIIAVLSELDCVRMVSFNLVDFSNMEFHTNDQECKSDLDEEHPAGTDWHLEAIHFGTALVNAGVIPDLSAAPTDVNTDVLFTAKLGVIDGAFDEWHEDLVNQLHGHTLNNYATVDDMVAGEKGGHGTRVAGLMGATSGNNACYTGIAIKNHLRGFATDTGITSNSSVFGNKAAISWMVGHNVKVINRSQGTDIYAFAAVAPGNTEGLANILKQQEGLRDIYEDLLNKLLDMGYDFIYCGSAGNSNDDDFYYDPSAYSRYIKVTKYNEDIKKDSTAHSDVDTSQVYCALTDDDYSTDAFYDDPLFMIESDRIRSRVICVGAMTQSNKISDMSCRGDRVDFVAPGEDIYGCRATEDATVTSYKPYDTSGHNGTSYASPIVAGTLGLAYSVNPTLSGSLMTTLLTNSSTEYIEGTYRMVNAAGVTNFARIYREISTLSGGFTSTERFNGIALATVVEGGTSTKLKDVSVTATLKSGNMNTPTNISKTWTTDKDGQVEVVLEPGEYTLLFEKEGYLSESVEFTSKPEETTFIGEVELFDESTYASSKYTITGYVSNALNNNVIDNADLLFRKGWNNRTGSTLSDAFATTANTDSNGKFTAKLKVGCYTAQVKKNGFITTYANIVVSPNADTLRISITPVLDEDEYRIVLTWGEEPYDVDAHLDGSYNGDNFYVNYSHMVYKPGSTTVATLDIDDRYSYGPETITLKYSDALGDCSFYVHDFSNRNNSSSTALSLSSAEVKVYSGNELVATYKIPMNRIGTYWNVFDIRDGQIVTVNTISNSHS